MTTTRKDIHEHATMLAECAIEEHRKYGGDLFELLEQNVDSSQYVIYNGHAMDLLNAAWGCDIDAACETIECLGGYPEGADFWQVQCITAYWTLHYMATQAMQDMLEDEAA